jgi:hypothetical protein
MGAWRTNHGGGEGLELRSIEKREKKSKRE